MSARPSAILLGSKPGAAVALRHLVERGWDVRAVVPSGGSPEWLPRPSLEETARSLRVPVEPKQTDLRGSADFVISYMFRHRVRGEVLRLATRAAVNFHAGPLPEFGGWAFYSIAILENSPEYGCTCHHMDDGFDTGPLLKVRRFPCDASQETAVTLERKAQAEMIRLFVEFCELAESGAELPSIPQDPAQMRYLKREEFMQLKEIPSDADAETADRIARAFWYPPYDCAYIRAATGAKIEAVPEIAKLPAATAIHADDQDYLHAALVAASEGVRA